jgi:hypothetical protein
MFLLLIRGPGVFPMCARFSKAGLHEEASVVSDTDSEGPKLATLLLAKAWDTCVRACVYACVYACVRACARACVHQASYRPTGYLLPARVLPRPPTRSQN